MNARDLPGYGDTPAPFGACPPNSPDYVDHDDEKAAAIATNIEAAREWLDSFIDTAENEPTNIKRMQQCRFLLVSCLTAIEEHAK